MLKDYKTPTTAPTTATNTNKPNYKRLLLASATTIIVVAATILIKNANASSNNSSIAQELFAVSLPPASKNLVMESSFEPQADTNWQIIIVRAGDNLSKIFSRIGLSSQQLQQVMQSGKETKALAQLYPQQKVFYKLDNDNQLTDLKVDLSATSTLLINKKEDSFTSYLHKHEVETRISYANATITSSLFAAANNAGLDEATIMKLAGIFAWDIDFALEIQPQDSFKVIYEEKYVNGEKIGNGKILAAEFNNKGKIYQAMYFVDSNGEGNYYTPEGKSMRKAFLRTPVKFSRISSHFSYGRKHPILHRIRAHKGVDYAAARGTPIRAAGDGKVVFLGRKGGYGKVITLQHGSKYSTLYAHLHKFNRGLHKGTKVKQGQIIGYVGSSGLATGPHLHYEFRVNGVHKNPLTVKLPSAKPLIVTNKKEFSAKKEQLLALLQHHDKLQVASAHNKVEP